MTPRYLLGAAATLLVAGAAHAQTYSTEPYCREFTKVVDIGGRPQSAYGQACMQPDGSWQIESDDIPGNQPLQYQPTTNQVIYQPAYQPVYEPVYDSYYPGYAAPAYGYSNYGSSIFSLSFSNYDPYRTRYYNYHGHGWRDWDRGGGWNRGHDWDRGRDRDWGHGRGGDRDGDRNHGWNRDGGGRRGNGQGNNEQGRSGWQGGRPQHL